MTIPLVNIRVIFLEQRTNRKPAVPAAVAAVMETEPTRSLWNDEAAKHWVFQTSVELACWVALLGIQYQYQHLLLVVAFQESHQVQVGRHPFAVVAVAVVRAFLLILLLLHQRWVVVQWMDYESEGLPYQFREVILVLHYPKQFAFPLAIESAINVDE